MRVHVVDPSAFTPPYDHALCAALARAGAEVELITSRFAYGSVAAPDGYARARALLPRTRAGCAGGRARLADQARRARARHAALPARRAAAPTSSTSSGSTCSSSTALLLPRAGRSCSPPTTCCRASRAPASSPRSGGCTTRVDALVVHSEYGRARLVRAARRRPAQGPRDPPRRVRAPGARWPSQPLAAELEPVGGPVVLFFGLLRPYKGIDVLLEAWRGMPRAPSCGSWACRGWTSRRCVRGAPPGVRFVPRFVADAELAAYFRRADLVVLPYSRTSASTSPACCSPRSRSASRCCSATWAASPRSPRPAPRVLVAPGDAGALRGALGRPARRRGRARAAGAGGARAAAAGPYSWDEAARRTLDVYRELTVRVTALRHNRRRRDRARDRLLDLGRPGALRPCRLRRCCSAVLDRAAARRPAEPRRRGAETGELPARVADRRRPRRGGR